MCWNRLAGMHELHPVQVWNCCCHLEAIPRCHVTQPPQWVYSDLHHQALMVTCATSNTHLTQPQGPWQHGEADTTPYTCLLSCQGNTHMLCGTFATHFGWCKGLVQPKSNSGLHPKLTSLLLSQTTGLYWNISKFSEDQELSRILEVLIVTPRNEKHWVQLTFFYCKISEFQYYFSFSINAFGLSVSFFQFSLGFIQISKQLISLMSILNCVVSTVITT